MRKVIRFKLAAHSLLLSSGVLITAPGLVAAESFIGPVNTSGHLGYFYRSFTDDGGEEDISHQLSGTVNASTFFGEPWLATSYLSLSLTEDSSETSNTNSSASTDSQLITGDFGLNVLPQSRTPFTLRFQATDSRVDFEGEGFTPITFVGEEYSTSFIGLRQAYITDNGGRYQLSYDFRNWESQDDGEYDDTTIGLDVDLRAPRQHFIGRGTLQTNEHSVSERENENLVVDLSHFYYPVRHFRLDTKASFYDYERSFLDPTSTDTRMSNLNIAQVSSNVFWRPSNYPLSFTAGARIYSSESAQDRLDGAEIEDIVLNGGLFYQLNQNFRLDASFTSTFGELDGVERDVHRQNAGFLYQSDWKEVFGYMHQFYVDGGFGYRAKEDDDLTDWSVLTGHGFGRTWWPKERTSTTSLRLNFSQAFGSYGSSGDEIDSLSGYRVDHSISLAFNQRAWGGNTLAQITLSDSRDFATEDGSTDKDTEQQLVNLQLSRDQDLGRRSSITGDITVQYVNMRREAADGAGAVNIDESDTTTATGRIMFQHYQMLGVPRLQFSSDFMISNTSTEGAIDRQDWENRLSYQVGKLETSVSYSLTETDSRNYDLLYFRLMRRF